MTISRHASIINLEQNYQKQKKTATLIRIIVLLLPIALCMSVLACEYELAWLG